MIIIAAVTADICWPQPECRLGQSGRVAPAEAIDAHPDLPPKSICSSMPSFAPMCVWMPDKPSSLWACQKGYVLVNKMIPARCPGTADSSDEEKTR